MSDKVWNQEVLQEIKTSFLDPKQIVYVADSDLITPSNLAEMAQQRIRFISSLPEVYGLASRLKEKAWKQDDWEEIGRIALTTKGARYKAQSELEKQRFNCEADAKKALKRGRCEEGLKRLLQRTREASSPAGWPSHQRRCDQTIARSA